MVRGQDSEMSIIIVTIVEMRTPELKFMTWSKNWGLFSVLPQHLVLPPATLYCKLQVICLFHPLDGGDRGTGVAFASLVYPSMENTAGHHQGIKWRRAG